LPSFFDGLVCLGDAGALRAFVFFRAAMAHSF
jgi:hypothetical protein